ncbi:MAG: ribokinase [Oscillospiraceae bacterium]
MSKHILVIGSINMDLTIYVKKYPVIGETIIGKNFTLSPGGKGANQAVACSKLGADVIMLGCVGNDVYGDSLINSMNSYGVDTTHIEVVNGSSGIAMITVCDGDNSIILSDGANAKVDRNLLDKNNNLFKWADIVLLQFEVPMETVIYGAKLAKLNGAKVYLNPAPMKSFPLELLRYIDVFVPNQTETEILLNQKINTLNDAEVAIKKLEKMFVKQAIITMGENGSVFNDGESVKRQDVFSVDVIDTTSAGDSFIGGLAVTDDKAIMESVKYATAVSALAVTKKGAQISIPTEVETNEFVKNFKKYR